MELVLQNSKAFQTPVVTQVLASLAKYTDSVGISLPTSERKINQLSPLAKGSTSFCLTEQKDIRLCLYLCSNCSNRSPNFIFIFWK